MAASMVSEGVLTADAQSQEPQAPCLRPLLSSQTAAPWPAQRQDLRLGQSWPHRSQGSLGPPTPQQSQDDPAAQASAWDASWRETTTHDVRRSTIPPASHLARSLAAHSKPAAERRMPPPCTAGSPARCACTGARRLRDPPRAARTIVGCPPAHPLRGRRPRVRAATARDARRGCGNHHGAYRCSRDWPPLPATNAVPGARHRA
jgi:hypothetical protein